LIHYHGTPLTPRAELQKMAGKHFCVSFARPDDAAWCLSHGQSVMWDNGAFSFYTRKQETKWNKFYTWLESRLCHPHWAVIPDVIDGTVEENWSLIKEWPHRKDCAAPVWHLNESLDHLQALLDEGFPRICFGSSGKYWQIGSASWERRMDQTFNRLSTNGQLPWIHMLRGLSLSGDKWPFASADSVNVARNFSDQKMCPERMARRIDSVQCPIVWHQRPIQLELEQ
jgi:hypothetical protein